ncbi:hypothetical protein ACQZ6F_33310 [Rhizobium sp. A22-96]
MTSSISMVANVIASLVSGALLGYPRSGLMCLRNFWCPPMVARATIGMSKRRK